MTMILSIRRNRDDAEVQNALVGRSETITLATEKHAFHISETTDGGIVITCNGTERFVVQPNEPNSVTLRTLSRLMYTLPNSLKDQPKSLSMYG